MSRVIFRRLDQLKAAGSLEDVRNLPGKYHELKGNRKGQLAAHLIEPDRIVFVPRGSVEQFLENGLLVWKNVTVVEIIGIGDYH